MEYLHEALCADCDAQAVFYKLREAARLQAVA